MATVASTAVIVHVRTGAGVMECHGCRERRRRQRRGVVTTILRLPIIVIRHWILSLFCDLCNNKRMNQTRNYQSRLVRLPAPTHEFSESRDSASYINGTYMSEILLIYGTRIRASESRKDWSSVYIYTHKGLNKSRKQSCSVVHTKVCTASYLENYLTNYTILPTRLMLSQSRVDKSE